MPGMFDQWDAKRERAQRPATPSAPPDLPVDPGRASAYALAALTDEARQVQAVPIGSGRNDQLNTSALKMFGYAEAGAISHQLVTDTLGAADGGLDYPATRKTIESAREAAARYGPKVIPESTVPTTTRESEVPPWLASDDPLDEHYVPRSTITPGTGGAAAGTSQPAPVSPDPTVEPNSTSPAAAASGTADPFVTIEVNKQRTRREAERILEQEEAVATFRVPVFYGTLADELTLPEDPVTYRVDEVFPTGANVVLTAQFKTGKTTMVNNLSRALVDGDPFLGVYDVHDPDGRVGLFNYEVDERQYRRWLRESNIGNPDRVAVLNLRGYRLPLGVKFVEDWVVEWLTTNDVRVWVVDPFARASVGIDENSNGEVGKWLDTLDVIKARAGVSELVLPNHTGRAQVEHGDERSRGATRLDDWADVRWLLTKDKDGRRYFRATGRDVETDEGTLEWDETTRHLTLAGGSRRDAHHDEVRRRVLSVITTNPGVGVRELRDHMKGTRVQDVAAAAAWLIAEHLVRQETHRGAKRHFPGSDVHNTPWAPDEPGTPDPLAT